jgi:hypothetical protein
MIRDLANFSISITPKSESPMEVKVDAKPLPKLIARQDKV